MNSNKSWIFIVLISVFLLFSLWSTRYELIQSEKVLPNRQFELVHNFPTDYNFYLSRIRQGIEGRFTVVEKYTSEPHAGSLLHVFYLVMGWMGRVAHVASSKAGEIYHVGRVVLGCVLLLTIVEFMRHSFRHTVWHIVAFLLVVTASSWPKFETVNGALRFGGYMPWWSVMDSLQRITFIPHVLAGQILILLLLMQLCRDNVIARRGNWIFLGLGGFVLGIVFPPGLLFVYVTLSILVLTEWISKRTWRTNRTIAYGVFFLMSFSSLLYLQLMVTFYPWKRLSEVDIIRPLPFDYIEYMKSLGPVFPLGLIGLMLAIWKKDKAMILSVSWVIAWMVLLFVFRFIPAQSPLRFSEMIPHVPLGVLTAYVFLRLSRLRQLKFISVIPIILVGFGLFHMYSSWLWQKDFVDHKMRATYPLVPTGAYVMYPLKDFISAIKFIENNSKRDDVVLSQTTAGNYIPVYSGNTVYVGHDNTVHLEEKLKTVHSFYSGTMRPEEARLWLKAQNLHIIFFGPQEREDGGINDLGRVYPFLTPSYSNTVISVYYVQ